MSAVKTDRAGNALLEGNLDLKFGKTVRVNGQNALSSVGVKVYRALLSQSGEDAPTAVVFENTLGGVPTLIRNGISDYHLILEGAFPIGRVWAVIGPPYQASGVQIYFTAINYDDANTLKIYAGSHTIVDGELAEVNVDGVLDETSIEILIYPEV